MPESSLSPFFSPHGIAVIGASQNPTKLGYGLARNLVGSNYQGVVHFVNPKGGTLFKRPIYSSLKEVPDPLDLAILLIPASSVPQLLHECGQRGLKAVIIGSGGFRETGPEGAALESECLHIAKSYNIRLLGPNCIGLIDTHLPLDATFLPPPGPLPGDVAFVSHSGAICAAVIDWARGQGFGLSRLISLGNQADINETDMLDPIANDPFTSVLTLYLEGISDGRRFTSVAGSITPQKPIIALKVGRFAGGQRAVASHTGALAGQESAYNAAFRRAGVIRAENSEEIFDWARALAWCPSPKGKSVAILTDAGGPGVTAADALEALSMSLAALADDTQTALRELLPSAASLGNPIDMLASATPQDYAQSLDILIKDPAVDSVMVIIPPPPMHTAGAVAKALIPVIHTSDKPVVIALMGERLIQEAVEHFRAARIPEYRFPERAASALAVLAQRTEYLSRAGEHPVISDAEDTKQAQAILDPHLLKISQNASATEFLPQEITRRLLQIYGIPTLNLKLARSPENAVKLAGKLGYPVAIKVASPDIIHKSDVKGVLLDLKDKKSVTEGYQTVVSNARTFRPQAEILGVYVQPMIHAGQEVLGAIQDSQFGPLVMFGSGGVEVEGLGDVSFALAPMTEEEAHYMLDSTWAGRKLRGYRDIIPADVPAVIQALLRLAQLSSDFPQLTEVEINPLRVFGEGVGIVALDVRIKVTN